jgi:hypothetical protein
MDNTGVQDEWVDMLMWWLNFWVRICFRTGREGQLPFWIASLERCLQALDAVKTWWDPHSNLASSTWRHIYAYNSFKCYKKSSTTGLTETIENVLDKMCAYCWVKYVIPLQLESHRKTASSPVLYIVMCQPSLVWRLWLWSGFYQLGLSKFGGWAKTINGGWLLLYFGLNHSPRW